MAMTTYYQINKKATEPTHMVSQIDMKSIT